MKLIVGLGNPGKEYELTRHNVGFMVIDSYVQNENWKNKFEGLYQILDVGNEKVIFLKPQTFMNLSGNSVVKVANYYNIRPSDILVIQDDMDLPFKKYKLKINSSSGGHNGIKSIIQSLNTEEFGRLKIGISRDKNGDNINYVLGKFSKEEQQYLQNEMAIYKDIIDCFVKNGFFKTVSKYNSRG